MNRNQIWVPYIAGLLVLWLLTFLAVLPFTDMPSAPLTMATPILLVVAEPDALSLGVAFCLLSPLIGSFVCQAFAVKRTSKRWLVAGLVLLTIYAALSWMLSVALGLAANNPV